MDNKDSKNGKRKDEEAFLSFEREFKEMHPELNDEELKLRCEQEWGKLSPVQKALFQSEPKDQNAFLNFEKEFKEKHTELNEEDCKVLCEEEWDKLSTVEKELFQNGPSCSVNCLENQRLCGSTKPRQTKAKTGRIKKKPYARPVKPQKNKKATKGDNCNRLPYTNNGFLNFLRIIRNTNKDTDPGTLAKQCFKDWNELSQEEKNDYRKKFFAGFEKYLAPNKNIYLRHCAEQ